MVECKLIKNGMVMDGTGTPAYRADVLVENDRILDVGIFPELQTEYIIDAQGLVVAPGFIDVHTHLDFFLPDPRHAEVLKSWAFQGVTTIVAGNCGFSPAPLSRNTADSLSTYWNFALPRDGLDFQWTSMDEYLSFLENSGQAFNAAILTGHNTLRTSVMGFEARFATENEVSRMKGMLRESLNAGSIGLSTGLFYCPGIFSHTEELVDLASVMTEFGVPLVTHTRGLGRIYDKAVAEVIHIAETNRIPLHLSHHAGGSGEVRSRTIQFIKEAQDRGVPIGHDNIPWAFGPTTILALLPPWLFDGGLDMFFTRLKNPDIRARAIDELENFIPEWPNWEHNYWTDKFFGFSNVLCGFRNEHNLKYEGLMMKDIVKNSDRNDYDTIFDLILEERGRLFIMGGGVDNPQGDEYMGYLLSDPDCSVMTDIIGADFKPNNPAAYGAFTKVLGFYARDKKIMTQEEAVRKMTSLPAQQMRLKDRGVLRKGAFADITIFNPHTVNNLASFSQPYQFSEGIEHVIVNGQAILENGGYRADAFAGKVLRRA